MIKKISVLFLFSFVLINAFAQNTNNSDDQIEFSNYNQQDTTQQKPHHYFLGGNFLAGFGDGGGSFGINPSVGYSINQYVDVGVGFNGIYSYQKFYTSEKYRTWNIGIAPFARVYPVNFLFFEASFEENFVTSRIINQDGSKQPRENYNAPSLIGSIGYATRVYGQSSFFFSVGMDFLNNINSPYRDHYIDNNGILRSSIQPVIKTGFNINLW
ncbi:hypothetical protein [Arachidicoccus sp.]|uniref:hypothetical protein n=1 Tax=Arachidicoccus sp. TaxID=1872624 RepID=UPI003D22A7EE